ncbi:MAG: T9SS type A sorting domain-containing protein [Chlorobi bacterium]|nr:T9SS type A sorting domain-containing protein [Chlorobiota bacterium]
MKNVVLQSELLQVKRTILFAFGFLLMLSNVANAQQGKSKSNMHHETIGDPYIPNSNEGHKTSPSYQAKATSLFFMTQVNVDENGDNILGDAGNEPSLAVDPTDPNRIVIGWRQFDDVGNNFRQAGYGYSTDAGQTWTFPGVINPGIFRSDPVLDFDSEGNFYYNSLTVDDNDNMWCDVFRITDGGVEWDEGTYAQGGDKQWMRIDKISENGMGNNYSFWTSYWSICYPGAFTRSVNGGDSYEDCVENDGNPYWGTLAVGADGTLYIVGASDLTGGIIVAKSTSAQNSGIVVGWDSYTNVYLGGELSGWTEINPQGLLGQAWVDTDISDGPGAGNVYVMAAVSPYSSNDPGEIYFAKSTDGGENWQLPVRINDDDISSNNTQWFGTMSVAPNGRIDAIWLDTRDNPGTYMSSLYYSYSIDQGETWTVNQKLSEAFDPHVGWPQQNKMGDYYDMVSDNEGAHLAWANTLNGEQDVYYGHIVPQFTGIANSVRKQRISVVAYPNPFSEKATVRYELKENGHMNLAIFDLFGKQVKSLVDKEQSAGTYNIQVEAGDLAEGVYYCRLNTNGQSETVQMVVIK